MRFVAWCLAAGLFCAPVVGRAEPAPAMGSLAWSRSTSAEDCIAEAELRGRVERLLGRPVFRQAQPPQHADLRVEGRVERVQRGGQGKWRAVLALSSIAGEPVGSRELRSSEASCRALDASLALAIALMIDPEAVLAPEAPRDAPVPPPAEAPEKPAITPLPFVLVPGGPTAPDRVHATPSTTADDPSRHWRLEAQAEGVLAFGLLPGVGTGLAARVLVGPPSFWSVAVEGTLWHDSEAQPSSYGSSIGLAQVGGLLCPIDFRRRRASLSACAGMQAGRMSATGFGFDTNFTEASWLLDAVAEARARYRVVGPVTVLVGATLGVPLNPYRFVYRDASQATPGIFRVAPVFASVDFGAGVDWR